MPFQFEKIYPENKYLIPDENPSDIKIVFFKEQKNLKNISCYSNENNLWRKSKISFENKYTLIIKIEEEVEVVKLYKAKPNSTKLKLSN